MSLLIGEKNFMCLLYVWNKQTKSFLTKMGKSPSFKWTIASRFYFSEVSTLRNEIGSKSIQKDEQIMKPFLVISPKYSKCKLYRNILLFKLIVSLDTILIMLIMIVDDYFHKINVWK